MKISSTPYDDVFRTLLNDCSSLILPVINELFGERYTGKEKIIFFQNEHFLNRQDGEENSRITDSSFQVVGETTKKYHCECQSMPDSSMLVRLFEYDSQIALDDGNIAKNILTVTFPHSAVLFLRHNRNTPDSMTICMKTPGGEISYDIPVMKVQRYSVEDIFAKKLYFLIPFYIFSHESRFADYERDAEQLETLRAEYAEIEKKLERLQETREIEEFTRRAILDMANRVLEHIAEKYAKVREGVKSVMGGKILEYEAKTIRNEGLEEGMEKGMEKGRLATMLNNVRSLMKTTGWTVNKAMDALNIAPNDRDAISAQL